MLEQKDLQAIVQVMGPLIDEKLDKRLTETETKLRGEMQEMKQELRGEMQEMKQGLRGEMQEMKQGLRGEMQEMSTRLTRELKYYFNKEIRKQMGKSTSHILYQVDQKIYKSESLVLDELELYSKKNEKAHDEIKERLDRIETIYRIAKNDSDTIQLILKKTEELDERLKVVEKKVSIA